jgi:hypothetical protein
MPIEKAETLLISIPFQLIKHAADAYRAGVWILEISLMKFPVTVGPTQGWLTR